MKKLLFVLAIGAFAAACNNSGSAETKATDSAATTPATDSTKIAPDTTVKVTDSAATKAADSTKKK